MRYFKAVRQDATHEAALYEVQAGKLVAPSEVPGSLQKASGYALGSTSEIAGTISAPVNLEFRRRVFCLGLNYTDHAAEVSLEDIEPVVFSKFSSVLTGPSTDVEFPNIAGDLDYEAEIAVLVGRKGRNIPTGLGGEHISGYFLANDLTSRKLQFAPGGQWTLGKNLDCTTPIGPVIAVPDLGESITDRRLRCWVNGEERQNASTSDMLLSPGGAIEYLSRFIALEVGDVILTGTPAGTAMGAAEIPYLQSGDVVEVDCEDLGSLQCTIRKERTQW